MRHFVHGPDGVKYGPADLATLQQWRNEGRLLPDTLLEPEVGGNPVPAKFLPGLFDDPQVPNTEYASPGFAAYPHAPLPSKQATNYAIGAIILGTISICACWPILGPTAIYCAIKARRLGSTNGNSVLIYAITCAIIGAVLGIVSAIKLIESGFRF